MQPPHRPEIDGLRALAVLPVMLFHAGMGAFSGGYVGVDVFFVISGFLITSIILRELQAGRFSFVRFYERRARRILPALLFTLLLCVPLAWVWMRPVELESFGGSLAATALSLSNVFFWRTTGYFDLAAEEKPLLHTWSLGVEEQYYLLFPLVMVLGWRLGLRRLAWLLGALALASLVGSEWALRTNRAAASFFLVPMRAWELFAGSLLAFALREGAAWPWRCSPLARNLLCVAGLLLVAVPMLVLDADTRFPGLSALPVVVGTVLLLALATPHTWVGRLLTLRVMTWVGLISYSAYLLHQPLFAFARLMSPGQPSAAMFAGLIVLTLLLAHASWRFVETPFRKPGGWSRRGIFGFSLAGSLLFLALGAVTVARQGLPQRFTPAELAFVQPAMSPVKGCPARDAWLNVCPLGARGAKPTVALLGDSHAYAITPALDEVLAAQGRAGVLVHTSCNHPIPGVFDSREANTPQYVAHCAEADRRLRAYLSEAGLADVIVAIRWTARLYPLGNAIDAPAFDNGEGGVETDYPYRRNLALDTAGRLTDTAAPKQAALGAYLADLATRHRLALLYPVPEVGWTPARLNLQGIVLHGKPPQEISTSWARTRERHAAATALLDAVPGAGIVRVRPQARLCDTLIASRCAVQARGQLFYADDDHLSQLAARWMVDDLLAGLAGQASTPPY
ncbi:acyltransferase family protein [Azohydromonas lata]|uniref:Acyltransferase family protein n=1 Tax=Azohydromonas lata TaxID=45677 RepID=A0ABU5IC49_9BURK|nr:acyltransferase family protein [Azohydromonas lata]MDZ5456517.1 acyltransferase family protein [Azohydromonas lata]